MFHPLVHFGGGGGGGGVCSTQALDVCGTLLSRHPKSCGHWPYITKPRLHTLGHGTLGSVFSFFGSLILIISGWMSHWLAAALFVAFADTANKEHFLTCSSW